MNHTIFTWLRTLPGLSDLNREELLPTPGSAALFTLGREELAQRQTVTGRRLRRFRLSYLLAIHSDDPAVLDQFLALDDQIQSQCPSLGDEQTVTLSQGRTTHRDDQGLLRAEAKLVLEFTKEVY